MITLKVDLESTQNYGMSIYKGDDSNFYMFNDCGDLLYKPKKTYGVKLREVWEFAIGTFKLNEDRIITQTQEYFEKYYVCDKAAYEESLKNTVIKEQDEPKLFTGANGGRFTIPHLKIQLEQGSIIYPRQNKRARCKVDGDGYVLLEKDTFLPKHYLSPEVEWVLEGSEYTLSEDYAAADDTDIEEEIQRVLEELKTSDIYGNTYLHLLTTLERLISIRGKI